MGDEAKHRIIDMSASMANGTWLHCSAYQHAIGCAPCLNGDPKWEAKP